MGVLKKVLIANRGEIACRIIRTCHELGIKTVAVYSDADQNALHVKLSDEAISLGDSDPRDSYLNIPKLIEAAKESGAEAIHPGYGFLSENAEFARACEVAGLVFIGPSADTIAAMGDKMAAKKLMTEHGVPTVPASLDPLAEKNLTPLAEKIGFPVLLKAAAGGGGKGMRVVRKDSELKEAFFAATREAEGAFGDGRIFMEKFLERPRHIEVQILADHQGHTVHLFERDCSVQRRHQKIIEESPSPVVGPDLRERLGQAAIKAAQAARYCNVGTVEFLLDQSSCHPETRRDVGAKDLPSTEFYFLEMNTRLQVEHPVTEWVTGINLVRWQLVIAAAQRVARSCLAAGRPPLAGRPADARSAPRQDPLQMISSRLLAPRGHAIELRIYAEDPANNFLPQSGRIEALQEPQGPGIRVDSCLFVGWEIPVYYDPLLAKLIVWGETRKEALSCALRALREYRIDGVVTNLEFLKEVITHPDFVHGAVDTAWVEREFTGWQPLRINPNLEDSWSPWIPRSRTATQKRRSAYQKEHMQPGSELIGPASLKAPMPGKVIQVSVKVGQVVEVGTVLMILEAMKMEHSITASKAGTVQQLNKAAGDQVNMGEVLAIIE